MDFSPSEPSEAIAAEVREFIAEHVTPEIVRQSLDTATMHNWDLHRALAAKKWLAPTWPVADGGLDMPEIDAMTLMNELMASGAPLDGAVTTIYGGSSEVLRSLIGQRGLGLPRG